MDILKIENFFANFSFFFLLISMISYWIQITFGEKILNFGRFNMICANFCIFSLLIVRWNESGHFPLSNLYESLMFLCWSLSTIQIFFETNPKNFILQTKQNDSFIGAFISPAALLINAFATFRLPVEMQHSSPLVPALQSNWLMMHVTVMILSYSALISGSLLSIAFLILTKNIEENSLFLESISVSDSSEASIEIEQSVFSKESSKASELNFKKITQENSNQNFFLNFSKGIGIKRRKFVENLDNLSYRILGIGFPFLTIGILSGAVWANEAWGSYWSWDPKETWALATWFIFAIYLHTRITKGWRGKKPAIIASLGFVIVWICFLGVNLLGEGLHSYGFFDR